MKTTTQPCIQFPSFSYKTSQRAHNSKVKFSRVIQGVRRGKIGDNYFETSVSVKIISQNTKDASAEIYGCTVTKKQVKYAETGFHNLDKFAASRSAFGCKLSVKLTFITICLFNPLVTDQILNTQLWNVLLIYYFELSYNYDLFSFMLSFVK